jgi:TPR repeat protein
MNALGDFYYHEKPPNSADAFTLFSQAAQLNYPPAFGNLAVLYLNGDKPVDRDPFKALKLVQQGIAENDDFCLFLYARCLESGTGVKKEPTQARDYYVKAAEAGSRPAADWCRKNKVAFNQPSERPQ